MIRYTCFVFMIIMKKCFKFSTWEEQGDFTMSVNESYIVFVEEEKYNVVRDEHGEMYSTRTKVEKIKQSIPRDLILQKLCEVTGAKMYGDYVVLNEIKNDYFNNDTVIVGDVMYFDYITGDVSDNYVLACTNVQDYEFYNHVEDNVFAEYSKYLRKAPHHWQSYKKILKI